MTHRRPLVSFSRGALPCPRYQYTSTARGKAIASSKRSTTTQPLHECAARQLLDCHSDQISPSIFRI